MARMTLTREFYIPENAEQIEVEGCQPGTAIYYFHNRFGKPAMMAFAGRAQKPTAHYYYETPEKRDAAMDRLVSGWREHEARKSARRAERSQGHSLKVGTILVNSWGYSMTLVDYYRVVKTTKCTVTLQQIHSKPAGGGDGFGQCGNVLPAPELGDKDTKPITVRCGPDNSPRMKHGWAREHDGRPNYFNTLD